MKYTLEGFSQQKAIECDMTCEDLVILRWFVDFKDCQGVVSHRYGEETYYWISYKYVLEQLPIVKCNKKNMALKFNRLVERGLLKHKTLKKGGTFSLYALGDKYASLLSDNMESLPVKKDPCTNFDTPPVSDLGYPLYQNQVNKDSSIIDSSIKDSSIKHIGDFASPDSVDVDDFTGEAQPSATSSPHRSVNENCNTTNNIVKKSTKPECGYAEIFEQLWKLYPKKEGKSSVSAKSKKALLSAGYDEIASCIDFYVRTKPDWQHLMNGSTFFNGRWKDYVTQNSDETSVKPQGGEDDEYEPFAGCY